MPVTAEQLIRQGGPTQNVRQFGDYISTFAYELFQNDLISAEQRDRIAQSAGALVTIADRFSGKKAEELTAEDQNELNKLLDTASGLGKELAQRGADGNSVFDNMLRNYSQAERNMITRQMRTVDSGLDLGIERSITDSTRQFTRNISVSDFVGNRLQSHSVRYEPTEAMKAVQRAGIPVDDPLGDNVNVQLENAFVLYLLSEENMSVDDLKNLGNLSSSERFEIGTRFLDALRDHPVNSDHLNGFRVSPEQRKENAAWYGRMTKKAIDKLKAVYRYPDTEELKDPIARARMESSPMQLVGHIGYNIDALTQNWRFDAQEGSFAQAFGGMQGLQRDLNSMKSAGAVHAGAGFTHRSIDPERAGQISSMADDFLTGLSGRRIDAVNAGGDLLKGERAYRNIRAINNRFLLDEDAYSYEHGKVARNLFSDTVDSLDLAALDHYIDAPDLKNLPGDELDQAAALFDSKFENLIQKEKNLTDSVRNDFDKSITGNFVITDSSDTISGPKRVNVSSMVDHLLDGMNVTREQKAKYEKAYILHMIAESKTTDDIKVEYVPFQIKAAGPLHDPAYTAEAPAASATYDKMNRLAQKNVQQHFDGLKKNKQDQIAEEDRKLQDDYDKKLQWYRETNYTITSKIQESRQLGYAYSGPALYDLNALKNEYTANHAQNHEIRGQRMNEEMELAHSEYGEQQERQKQHDIERRKKAHEIADKIKNGDQAGDTKSFDRETKERWKSEAADREAAKNLALDEKYKISTAPDPEPRKAVDPAIVNMGLDRYREKIRGEVVHPGENDVPLRNLHDAISPDRRELLDSKMGDKLTTLQEMFHTKKRGWIFNSNSDQYDEARRDVDDFMNKRNEMAAYFKAHENDAQDSRVLDTLQQMLNSVNAAEDKMKKSLSTYIKKVTKGGKLTSGDKGIENMTQDAGAARLSGAVSIIESLKMRAEEKGFIGSMGIDPVDVKNYHGAIGEGAQAHYSEKEMEIIAREAEKMNKTKPGQGYDRPEQLPDEKKNELLNSYAERIKENAVHITNFTEVFEKSFNKLKQDGAADARGKSVEQAQNSVKAKVAGEKMAKTLKSAKESIENDLKKHGHGPQM